MRRIRYTHLPIVHAWALTIHKAQGLTLEDARVDFDYGAFASGQAYVAVYLKALGMTTGKYC